jgi:hypothetical protein
MKRPATKSAFHPPSLIPGTRVGSQRGRTVRPSLLARGTSGERNVDRHQLVPAPRRNRVPCSLNPRGCRTEPPCQPRFDLGRLSKVRLPQWIVETPPRLVDYAPLRSGGCSSVALLRASVVRFKRQRRTKLPCDLRPRFSIDPAHMSHSSSSPFESHTDWI